MPGAVEDRAELTREGLRRCHSVAPRGADRHDLVERREIEDFKHPLVGAYDRKGAAAVLEASMTHHENREPRRVDEAALREVNDKPTFSALDHGVDSVPKPWGRIGIKLAVDLDDVCRPVDFEVGNRNAHDKEPGVGDLAVAICLAFAASRTSSMLIAVCSHSVARSK